LLLISLGSIFGLIVAFQRWIEPSLRVSLSVPLFTILLVWFLLTRHIRLVLLNRLILDGNPYLCRKCGCNLTGNTSGVCSECGAQVSKAAKPSAASLVSAGNSELLHKTE
jgi:hypothetical protein